jgi:hypothetical protein
MLIEAKHEFRVSEAAQVPQQRVQVSQGKAKMGGSLREE